jgi:hypothetical protein
MIKVTRYFNSKFCLPVLNQGSSFEGLGKMPLKNSFILCQQCKDLSVYIKVVVFYYLYYCIEKITNLY